MVLPEKGAALEVSAWSLQAEEGPTNMQGSLRSIRLGAKVHVVWNQWNAIGATVADHQPIETSITVS
jgi:hypothetical protein